MDLKDELWRRRLKQVHVAQQLGIHPSRFTAICNKWARPTAEQSMRIAAFLGVDEAELFPPRERPAPEMRGAK